jgi:hypothetical protein
MNKSLLFLFFRKERVFFFRKKEAKSFRLLGGVDFGVNDFVGGAGLAVGAVFAAGA